MQVILSKNVPKLGQKDDIVQVKPGYFRNFLFPLGKADVLTAARKVQAEKRREKRILTQKNIEEKAHEIKESLDGLVLTFERKTTSKGKLYGSIGEKDLIDELKKKAKLDLKKENMVLPSHLKELGEHEVRIKLSDSVEATIKVNIVEASS